MPRTPNRGTQRAAALPEETAPEHWLRTIRLSGFTVLMLGLLVLAVIVLAPNLRILIEQRQQIIALEQSVKDAQQSVDQLTKDVARWDDPAYIVSQARERLYYVFPRDISYLVVGDSTEATTADGQPISSSIQTTKVDWVHTLLASIYTAGLTDAPPSKLVAPVVDGAQ
jgi:cell division protein FtsB